MVFCAFICRNKIVTLYLSQYLVYLVFLKPKCEKSILTEISLLSYPCFQGCTDSIGMAGPVNAVAESRASCLLGLLIKPADKS